jgi:hypothetical protein
LECCQCGRRLMLSQRELSKRLKTILPRGIDDESKNQTA